MLISLDSLELDTIKFAAPKKYNDHYSVNVSVGDNDKLLIQSPKFTLNTDLNLNEPVNKFVDFLCGSTEFIESIKSVDQTMANVIKENRDTWFPGKDIDDSFVEVGQVPSVLSANTIRMRVNKHLQVFDSASKTPLDNVDNLEVGSQSKCIMQLAGIWFTATRWGLTWNLVQMKIYPTVAKKMYKGYMFPDDEEDSNDHQSSPYYVSDCSCLYFSSNAFLVLGISF